MTCELANNRGAWQISRTPGSVTVISSTEPLKVSCHSRGGDRGAVLSSASSHGTNTGAKALGGAGAALGATGFLIAPVVGVLGVLAYGGLGLAAGQVVDATQRSIRYPDLISVPMRCNAEAAAPKASDSPLGMTIRSAVQAEADAAGLRNRHALFVVSVLADGRAAAAGLRGGDLILAADGRDVGDASDFEERMARHAPGAATTLQVRRGGEALALVVDRKSAVP